MIPAKFDYTRPSSLDEAVSALDSGATESNAAGIIGRPPVECLRHLVWPPRPGSG